MLRKFCLPPYYISICPIPGFRTELTVRGFPFRYARILHRVNNISSETAKTKARRLLGFIGCSPVPLTIYELDQLLTLELYAGLENVQYSSCTLNPVQLCGPIVEVVDEYVHFVHFTVKE